MNTRTIPGPGSLSVLAVLTALALLAAPAPARAQAAGVATGDIVSTSAANTNFRFGANPAIIMEGSVIISRPFVFKDKEGKEQTGTYRLTADKAEYLTQDQFAKAEGNVKVTNGVYTATSRSAEYNISEGYAILYGNVRITWAEGGPMNSCVASSARAKVRITFDDAGQVTDIQGDGGGQPILINYHPTPAKGSPVSRGSGRAADAGPGNLPLRASE